MILMYHRFTLRRLFCLTLVVVLQHIYILSASAQQRCFPETNQCIDDAFRGYWEQNGALPVFGYPVTPAANELNRDDRNTYLTQWFERNRLELHPENAAPYGILLGRLGADRLRQQGRDWFSFPKADPQAAHYFAQTGHAIAPQFWNYWSEHGLEFGDPGVTERESLALFGFPLSEPTMETNASGDTVLTQWFERARFEYHPANSDPYKVLLGLLGNEIRTARTPQTITEQSFGASLGGDYLVSAVGDGVTTPGEISFEVYNLLTGEQWTIPSNNTLRGRAATDGTTIVWSEWQPGSNQHIVAYDIGSRTTRTILEREGISNIGNYAVADGTLFYVDATPSHVGIWAYIWSTGQERRLSDEHGTDLVVRDGILLWQTGGGCGEACVPTITLHLLRLNDGDHRILSSDTEYLSGYDVRGDTVVWATYNGPIYVYSIAQGSATPLQQGDTTVVFRPVIGDDRIAWSGPSARRSSEQWSLLDRRLSTGETSIVATLDSEMAQLVGFRGTTLVWSETTPTGPWRLRVVNLE